MSFKTVNNVIKNNFQNINLRSFTLFENRAIE